MSSTALWYAVLLVALLAEGVDRNSNLEVNRPRRRVALLAEGVDRNFQKGSMIAVEGSVALLAEGVDRNQARRAAAG